MEDKNTLRRRLRAQRDGLKPEERRHLSEVISESALNLRLLHGCRRLALYASFQSEVQTASLHRGLRARGVDVIYPRVVRGQLELEFALVEDLASLVCGAFSIQEPEGPAVPLSSADVVIVPGVGFDRRGNRLGYGAGHYDRTLSTYDRPCIALAFATQVVERIPASQWDRPMDVLVTEEGAIKTAVGAKHLGAGSP